MIPVLERRYKDTDSPSVHQEIQKYMTVHTCPACEGRRLRPEALSVVVSDLSIDQVSAMTIEEARRYLAGIELSKRQRKIAHKVVEEIRDRLQFLDAVGVGDRARRWSYR